MYKKTLVIFKISDEYDYERASPLSDEHSVTWYKDCSEIDQKQKHQGKIEVQGKEVF